MRRAALLLAAAGAAVALAVSPGLAGAGAAGRLCGPVGGVPIRAHEISCRTARHVYKADMGMNLPGGWTCSAALARCYRGEVGDSAEYLWWRPTTYRLEREGVVLGGVVYGAPNGEGWGSMEPATIFNGGDPSGLISEVHWSSWGGPVALGRGRNSIFKPHGGYYRRQVVIQLKATRIGHCEGHRAYLKLLVREPRKPGGALGPWLSWSGPRTLCQPY